MRMPRDAITVLDDAAHSFDVFFFPIHFFPPSVSSHHRSIIIIVFRDVRIRVLSTHTAVFLAQGIFGIP